MLLMASIVRKNQQPTTVLFWFWWHDCPNVALLLYLPRELLRFTALEEITHAEIDYMRKHGIRKFIKLFQIPPHVCQSFEWIAVIICRAYSKYSSSWRHSGSDWVSPVQSSKNRHYYFEYTRKCRKYLEFHQLNLFSFIYSGTKCFP